jgi:hypothetical protein
VTGLLLAGSLAAPSAAATLEWAGTLSIEMSGSAPVVIEETGLATVNGSSGLGHLNTLRLPGGFTSTSTVPLTDPGLPATLLSVQVKEQLGSATLGQISGGPPLSPAVMPMQGTANLCVLFPGCGFVIPIPLTVNGTRGIGIGGSITATTFLGGTITLQGTVWTIGQVSVPTTTGTLTAQGFVHGPASNTSSTAKPRGVVQLVTPSLIFSTLGPPIPVMSTLRLHFTPEPGEMALLGTGLAFLAAVARRRARG